MHRTRALTVALATAIAVHAHAQAATISLRERVSVEGDAITLGQLAEIAPEDLAETLGAVEVGPAPLPGDSRLLTAGYLKIRLRSAGFACSEIAFTGAERVEVRRASVAASQEAEPPSEAAAPPPAPQPLIVPRGTRLRLTVSCGAVSIATEATLLEDAAVGARAAMRVEQTRETVVAQIVHPTEAQVDAQ